MKSVLITGGAGLIGTACCDFFLSKGWQVTSLDNNMRQAIFGKDASVKGNIVSSPGLRHVEGDVRDKELVSKLITDADAIVHLAAQPSHPKSLEIPMEDFQINAFGTVQLLELVRQLKPEIPFAFMSSNKVYGDQPNLFKYRTVGKRYENESVDSFDETLPIDRCGHTPFGCSKVAADVYTQEYGINYGMKTASFRGGCLTGKNSRAVEMHGYLPYIIRCALAGKEYTIFGGGLRVRDQIHSSDVASALYEFISNPRKGQAYNIGGQRQNSVSIFETIDAIRAKTGIGLKWKEGPDRESDHMWWISDMSKFKKDYPSWRMTKDLDFIFNEIIMHYIRALGLKMKLRNESYFQDLRRE